MMLEVLSQQSQWVCVSGGYGSSIILSSTECFNYTSLAWQTFPSLAIPAPNTNMMPFNLGGVACLAGGTQSPLSVYCTNTSLFLNAPASAGWIQQNDLHRPSSGNAPIYGLGWVGIFGSTAQTWSTANIAIGTGNIVTSQSLSPWTDRQTVNNGGAVVPFNGTSCVTGGQSSASVETTCLIMDLTSPSNPTQWVPGPNNLTVARYQHSPLSLAPGVDCVVGGFDLGLAPLDSVECTANSFNFSPYTPYPQMLGASTNVSLLGIPCITGGSVAPGQALNFNTVYCANYTGGPSIDWISGPNTTTPRSGHTSFIVSVDLPPTLSPTSSPTKTPTTLIPTRKPTPPPALPQFVDWTCVTGGWYTNTYNSTECYNSVNKSWQLVPSLTLPTITGQMTAFNLGTVACVVGGNDQRAQVPQYQRVICTNASALSTDPTKPYSSSSWVRLPDMTLFHYSGAALYGDGWIGVADGTLETAMVTGSGIGVSGGINLTWVKNASLSPATSGWGVISLNGSSCIVGGPTLCYSGNPPNGLVSSPGPSLQVPRAGTVTISLPDRWCVLGGSNLSQTTQTSLATAECINNDGHGPGLGGEFTLVESSPNFQGAVNVSIAGLPCVAGGGSGATSLSTVICVNASGSNSTHLQWMLAPFLIIPRSQHTSFKISVPVVTSAPTSTPTLSPTSTPTSAPTSTPTPPAPTQAPTPAPTPFPTSTSTIGSWKVDYPSSLSSSSWSTFSIIEPVPSSYTIQWIFPALSPTAKIPIQNTSQIQIPPFSFTFSQSSSLDNFTLIITDPNGNGASDFHYRGSFTVVWPTLTVRVNGGDRDVASNTIIQLSSDIILGPIEGVSYNYSWQTVPPCTLQITTPTSQDNSNISLATGATQQACVVSLKVSDNLGRMSSTISTLQIRLNLDFTVTVGLSGEVQFPFPTSTTLRLLGTVIPTTPTPTPPTSSSYTNSWTILPPLSVGCANSAISSSRALVVPSFCLNEGTNYTIVFRASNDVNAASATFSFLTSTRPFGTCSVTPTSGLALTTNFNVNCTSSQLSQTSLTYILKRVETDSSGNPFEVTISLPQSRGQFPNIFLNLLNPLLPATQSEPESLIVQVLADSGDFTEVHLPNITLFATTTNCPSDQSDNNNNNIQYLTTLVRALQPPLVSPMNSCTLSQRQVIWDALWQLVQQLVNLPYLDSNTIETVSTALDALLTVSPPMASGVVTTPTNFAPVVGDVLLKLLNSPEGASTSSTSALLSAVETGLPIFFDSSSSSSCAILNQVIAALASQVQYTVSASLPGEQPTVLSSTSTSSSSSDSSSEISVVSAAFFADSSASLNSLSLTLPTSLLSQGGDLSRIVVTQYQSSLGRCRPAQEALVGPVVDITLSGDGGSERSVTNVVGGFSFQLPFINGDQCGQSRCVWWDPSQAIWRPDGCTSEESQDQTSVICTCTHLTEFSLLLDPGCVTAVYTGLYLAIMAFYALLVAVSAGKLLYRLSATCFQHGQALLTSLVIQHVLIMVLGSARIAACYILSSSSRVRQLDIASRAAVLLLPYLVMFWIYTLMVFQWAALYHYGMKHHGNAFSKVRSLFGISNLLISGAVIAVIVAVGSDTLSTNRVIVLVASIIIAAVTGITAIAFIIYARVIFSSIGTVSSAVHTTVAATIPKWHFYVKWDVRHKILAGGTVVSLMLCVEAMLHIVSAASLASSSSKLMEGDVSEVVTLVAELVCLSTLVIMYHRAMMTEGRKTKTKRDLNEVQMAPGPT